MLPPLPKLRLVQLIDEYLAREINDKRGKFFGSVDELIRKNEDTIGRRLASKRLRLDLPIQIAVVLTVASNTVDVRSTWELIEAPARLHVGVKFPNGVYWRSIVPLQYLLKGWGNANAGHQCYVHSISTNVSQIKSWEDLKKREENSTDDYHYVGITGRNWLHRFSEHLSKMARGSRLSFHRALREFYGHSDVHFISQLGEINLSYHDAMNWEEVHVDRLGTQGLNMIPGGFKGLRYLHEHRIIDNTNVSLAVRDQAIVELHRQHPRKGLPNPFLAELWQDDWYYLKVIGNRTKTLTPEQVRSIIEMARDGVQVSEITEAVGAINDTQVRNVIVGRTYRRTRRMLGIPDGS
ncbi:MAG: hypothetical protein EA384_07195 [Spirochaetaceae bacterium]|nr:MAG: hypothetical protein EA384_07195 [Spirochaetaceae bacterium]